MKKRVSIGFTVLILLGSSLTPANAVLGLSACEKVKKQVLSYEKTEKPLIKDWQNYVGDWIWDYPSDSRLKLQKRFVNIVNIEVKMYSLEINNPKCFTNSQNIYIKKIYPKWKEYQQINRAYPDANNADDGKGYFIPITWDSIYNQ